jgi:hypothetical protein
MESEDVLLQQIKDALEIRRNIAEGTIVLLDAGKVQKAFDYIKAAETTEPIRPRWSENLKLWGLIAIASWGMVLAVVLSIIHPHF